MSETRPIGNDAGEEMDINFAGQSPHVFAYRMWFRRPGDESWTLFGEGDTSDDVPDHQSTGPHPADTQIIVWTAVGGKPNSNYRFLLTFSQGGAIVTGGVISRSGKTSGDGGGARKTKVILT